MGEQNTLDRYIKEYSVYIFEKEGRERTFGKKTFPQKLKDMLKGMTYYGTKAVFNAYNYIT